MSIQINWHKDQKIWISSDYHFSHWNINNHCNRGFSSVEEMDGAIIAKHNSVVSDNDYFIHLGDLYWGHSVDTMTHYLSSMNGAKILLLGNHDYLIQKMTHDQKIASKIDYIGNYIMLKTQLMNDNNQLKKAKFAMMHFPILQWDHKHYGSMHCFGHSHGSLFKDDEAMHKWFFSQRCMDVGLDTNGLLPYNLQDIYDTLKDRDSKHIDHH